MWRGCEDYKLIWLRIDRILDKFTRLPNVRTKVDYRFMSNIITALRPMLFLLRKTGASLNFQITLSSL
jgi:hypothetical protein